MMIDDVSHLAYLKQKCSLLTEDERLCVLMLDEIYVSPKVSYKGGSLNGFAENDSSDLVKATTVQAFMISSVLSKHKDVAALVPVTNMDATFLHSCTMKVLELTEKAGFRIVALISDNNRVNRNMFEPLWIRRSINVSVCDKPTCTCSFLYVFFRYLFVIMCAKVDSNISFNFHGPLTVIDSTPN